MDVDSGGHIDVNFDWSSELNQRADAHVEIEHAEHNRAGDGNRENRCLEQCDFLEEVLHLLQHSVTSFL